MSSNPEPKVENAEPQTAQTESCVVEMKVCTKCGVEKGATEENFERRKSNVKLIARCRICMKLQRAEHYQKNKVEILEKTKQYREENIEKIREYDRERSRKKTGWVDPVTKQFTETKEDGSEVIMRVCKGCCQKKELIDSNFARSPPGGNFFWYCKVCRSRKRSEYYQANQEDIKAYNRNRYEEIKDTEEYRAYVEQYQINNEDKIKATKAAYREEHKEEAAEYKAQWYQEHKEELRPKHEQYRQDNKEKLNAQLKERRKNDFVVKMAHSASTIARLAMKNNGGSKNNEPMFESLPYTKEEFCQHIIDGFTRSENLTSDGKIWMTKENHGVYNRKIWVDEDFSTQSWQIDHIIPQSDLPYTSMHDENFKKVWALENIRPYSAKLNVLEGVYRVRHTTKKRAKISKSNKDKK